MAIEFLTTADQKLLLNLYHKYTGKNDRPWDYYFKLFRWKIIFKSFSALIIQDGEETVGFIESSIYHLEENPKVWDARFFVSDIQKYGKIAINRLIEDTKSKGAEEVILAVDEKDKYELFMDLGANVYLDVVESHFDLQSWELPTKMLAPGYKIVSFKSIRDHIGDDVYPKVLRILRHVIRETPGQESQADAICEQWLRKHWSGDEFLPEGCLFVERDNQLVGIHNIMSKVKDEVFSDITGIHHNHRGRGLTEALKTYGMEWAKRQGYKRFQSNNEVNNPMRQLNLHLGFKEATHSWEFRLTEPIP
ncbi:MAG: GNAT family N-acetyltransferase [Bacteriovoracaceae bacterium]|nr:GNAT family N-acetyltransferase [Bacteriovoracaceae bacterium]